MVVSHGCFQKTVLVFNQFMARKKLAGEECFMMATKMDRESALCSRAMRRKNEYAAREKAAGRRATLRARVTNRVAELELWRRKTSMTLELEPFMDDRERREGLKRLVKWIEDAVSHRGDAEARSRATALQIENCKFQNANWNGGDDVCEDDDREARKAMGLGAEWRMDAEAWARVRACGVSVEALCERLGMSRARLTRLCREYCNLSAQEVIDGFRLRGLKNVLLARMREAARQMWGAPGYFAAFKCEGFLDCEGRRVDPDTAPHFESRDVERWEERKRRIGELATRIRRGFDGEAFAARMGYLSEARLKRACLNVFGRRMESIERIFSSEIVDYYLAAEDREMRALARREPAIAATYRAREVYHGREEAPDEPFLDRWSAAEVFNAEWLRRMRGEFG